MGDPPESNPNYPNNPWAADPDTDLPPKKPPGPVPDPDSPEIRAQKEYDRRRIEEMKRRFGEFSDAALKGIAIVAIGAAFLYGGWLVAGAAGLKTATAVVVIGVAGAGSSEAATSTPAPTEAPQVDNGTTDNSGSVDNGTSDGGTAENPGIVVVNPGDTSSSSSTGSTTSSSSSSSSSTNNCDHPDSCGTGSSTTGGGSDTGGTSGGSTSGGGSGSGSG